MGFAFVLGVVGGDDCRSDLLLFPDTPSASSTAGIEGNRPLSTSGQLYSQFRVVSSTSISAPQLTALLFSCGPAVRGS